MLDPRSPDAATQYDELLTQQGVLGNELRSRTGEVPGGTDPHLRRRAGRSKQALDHPDEGADQGERVHGYGGSGRGFVDHERTQCEPDWGRQSSPLEPSARRRSLTASSLGNPLFTWADVKCSQDD